MRMCPNLSNPQIKQEFDELVSVLGENVAYYVWDLNNGYSLDYAPNGALSKLFQDLFDYYKDRNKAIEAKAKTLSKEFKLWFLGSKVVDDNGEPLIVYHTVSPNRDASFGIFDTNVEGRKTMVYHTDNKTMSYTYAKNHKNYKTLESVEQRISEIPNEILKQEDFIKKIDNNFGYTEKFIVETLGYDSINDTDWITNKEIQKKNANDVITKLLLELTELLNIKTNPKIIDYVKVDFLSIKNPLEVYGNGNNWDELSDNPALNVDRVLKYNKRYDTYLNNLKQEAISKLPGADILDFDELYELLSQQDIENINTKLNERFPIKKFLLQTTRDIEHKYEDNDKYDGIIFYDITDYGGGANFLDLNSGANNVFAVKNPNQIKSIDNNGQFSLTDNNIYHYVKDNIKPASTVSYHSGKQGIGKLFTGKNQSAKQVLANLINNSFITELLYELALSVLGNIEDSVEVELVNNTNYFMAYQNGKIYINIDGFNSYSNYDIANAFLHESLHHFTVNKYSNDKQFRNRIDSLFNKVSEQFPESEYKRAGLYYGLTSPLEFISELYVNKAFRDAVVKKNMSLWRRLLYTILNALKLVKLADKLLPTDIYQVYNSITDAINNRKLDPDLEDTGEMFFYLTDLNYSWLKGDATNLIKRAITGLKASEKALKSRDKSPVLITKLQQDISAYEIMLLKGEDLLILVDFIKRASTQFKPVLNRIRNAINNPELLTNDDLKNFKNDFLDFYGPLTEDINKKLFYLGYFNNLNPQLLETIKNQLSLINKAYQEIQGKYNYLLKLRVINLFKLYGKLYDFPTLDIESFINDKLNDTPLDMNNLYRYLLFMSNSTDTGLRIVNRIMTDINSLVQWFANNKTQNLIRQFSNITKSELLLYFEKDKEGKTTGYLVRPLNYGLFKKDYSQFLRQLDEKYGVIDLNYYLLDDDDFVNYCLEKEQWLEEHCERKFKNKYYREYNKLSQLARSKSKLYSELITAIIESVTDENGPHLEQLSDSDWTKLNKLYISKRNLSSDYNLDGTLKQGEDLAVAKEFQRFYEAIGQDSIKSKKLSQSEIELLISQKEKELSKELFLKWFQRNISYQFTDEFVEAIKATSIVNFGSDLKLYDELYEERRQLLLIGRDNNNPINIAPAYERSVKDRILELDQQINKIRSRHDKANKKFFEIADIIPTEYYKRDEAEAKKKGKDAYNKWYKANHYVDAKGYTRIASYYTRLVPKDLKYVEYRLSRMNQELDKNSDMINPNYNFEDPEYYQPKKSLYDNTTAYEAARKTKAQQEVYKTIVDTMEEANSKLSFMSKRDNYRLPQATGDFIDFTMRQGNFFKNIGYMIRDSITQRNDDTEFSTDNRITKADGTLLNLVPTHYIQMLEHPENISRNLVGLLSEYSRMAENYRLKNEHASEFDIIQVMYDNRTFTQRNANNDIISNIEGRRSNTSTKLREYLEILLYGRSSKPWNWTIPGTKVTISITKIMRNIERYASASNLGNNFLSIAKSILQGLDKSFVEGVAGQFYTIQDIGKSYLRLLWRTPKRLLNIGNPKENDISYALLEHNGIAHDTREKTEGLLYLRGIRLFYKYLVWGGWLAADFMVKVPIVESVYANVKYIPEQGKFMSFPAWEKLYPNESIKEKRKRFNRLKTVSALDVYTVKDGKLVVRPEYKLYEEAINDKAIQQTLRNISTILCSRIDGLLRQEDKLMIFLNAIGAAIGMHRSFFIVNANENLFKGYQYNPLIEDYDEAKYTSGFVGIAKWISNLYNGVRYLGNREEYSKNKKSFTNPELYNMKRILTQLAIIGMLFLLVAIWLKPEADKDKKNYLKQSSGYLIDALRFEEFSEYNPLDLVNQVKNVSPAISPFENTLNLVNPFKFNKNYSTDIIKSGYYKGMPKWLRTLIKATPGLRGAWESQDARTKWQYLKSQLDK